MMVNGTVLRRSARHIVIPNDGVVRSRFFMKKNDTTVKKQEQEQDQISHESNEMKAEKVVIKREVQEVKEEEEDHRVRIPPPSPPPKRRRTTTPTTHIKVEIKHEEDEAPIKQEDIKQEVKEEVKNAKIPTNFYPIYSHIKAMRLKIVAPVDTMGCAEIPITLNQEMELTPQNYRFQLLISLMLSSQTKDEINFKAMFNMKTYFQEHGFEQGITLEAIRWCDEQQLDTLIYSVGFHTRKASFIKRSAEILHSEWNGDVPNTVEGLVSLPGVGPKMAYLTLQKAWDLTLGIGVDTHLDRLAKMWRWVQNKKGPEQTRLELESWLPHELWNEINPELVGFGQSICLPRGRRCDLCTLSKTKLCSNVDRAQLKKVSRMSVDEVKHMNRTLRFDPEPLMKDIEDIA